MQGITDQLKVFHRDSILTQFYRVKGTLKSNGPAGYYLNVHLDTLAWIGHLFVRFGLYAFFFSGAGNSPRFRTTRSRLSGRRA